MFKSNASLLNMVLFIGCALLLLFSVWKLVAILYIYINGETSEATITAYTEKVFNLQSSTGSDLTYSPIYTFTTSEGKEITLYSDSYNKEKKYTIGDKVKVYYPKNNPKSAKLEGYFPWKMYSILTALGLVGLLLFWKELF
ncbi:MAG: DUF3592 domain-containing protein [Oceanihabitans sp.]|nr:DUF3592 domain-containing protein [Oceanihabitans sp.]